MADWHGLNTRRGAALLAVIAVLVLAGHLVAIAWLARQLSDPPPVRPLSEPLFTRLLAPTEPPPVPQATATARPAPPTGRMTASLAVAPDVRPAASIPKPAPKPAPAPTPAPPPMNERAEPETATSAQATAEPEAPAPAPAPLPLGSAPTADTPAAAVQAGPASVPLDRWPTDTRLTYTLQGQWRGGPIYGSARVQWQRQGVQYQAQVTIEVLVFGSRVMTSQGEVTPQGLVPRIYEEQTRNRRRTARMNDTEVILSDGRSVPRPPHLQDTASQFVELGYRFATGQQALALGESVAVWLARPGGVDLWTYDVVAQDLLPTARFGEVAAWRLRPRPLANPRGRIAAEVWFAPSLQYLPARIRVTEGEDIQIDLVVETIEQR